jgi:hypothetical protein
VASTVTRSSSTYRRTEGSSQWGLTYSCVCPVARGVFAMKILQNFFCEFCRVPLSVHSHVTTLELLAGISWNLVLGSFTKM